MIGKFNLLLVQLYVLHYHLIHIILWFGRIILRGSVFDFLGFLLRRSHYGLIIIGIKQGVYLIESLRGMVIFLDDLLTALAFVMFSLELAF
jgi:hypothetical protein